MSRSRSLRRLGSTIDLPPSLRSPATLRESSSTSAANVQGGSGSHPSPSPPLSPLSPSPSLSLVSHGDGGATQRSVFTPSSGVVAFEKRSYIAPRGTPLRQPPPRLPRKGAACRCHCTALGEGHYSEQGEPVTSAPTPAIDPTPSDGGAMHPMCTAAFRVNS